MGKNRINKKLSDVPLSSDPIEGPKPGQRVVATPEEFDDDGNYVGDMQIREDEDLRFEDEPEKSFEEIIREDLA